MTEKWQKMVIFALLLVCLQDWGAGVVNTSVDWSSFSSHL